MDDGTSEERRRNSMQKSADTSSSSHDAPMEPRAYVDSVFTHFPKDQNCEICLKTKITRASCRRRAGAVVPERKILVTRLQRITKSSVKKVNRGTVIDMSGGIF